MKKQVLLVIGLFIGCFIIAQKTDFNHLNEHKKQYDIYGRIIKDDAEQKINFSKKQSESLNISPNQNNARTSPLSVMQHDKTISNTSCEPEWKYSIWGTCIGRRSLHALDIDNDGKIEIVCSAQVQGFMNSGKSFWYIIRYNPAKISYDQVWVSDVVNNDIIKVSVFDINNDGISEIFIATDDGFISVYNALSKVLISRFTPTSNYSGTINDIEFGDADNDGVDEIAISDNSKIYLFYKNSFSYKSQIPYGSYEFKIGNVDGDIQKEIVTTMGKVIYFNGSIATVKWIFDSNVTSDSNYMLGLSDIDNDGMLEIVRAKNWDYIDVYDVNSQSLKYEIPTDQDINALLLKDVNNDGIDEILYGDGQWGKIYCFNSVTHTEMWSVTNPEHGVTGIAVADPDNDDTLEVMWGAGWTSTGEDFFYVANVDTHVVEWVSVELDGPFYAIATGDVDNDGTNEIVAVSYESNSGYKSGIISVFNALTHELEWQCNGDYLNNVWTGIFDCKINDIDNDGFNEIIIAAGQTYTGEIWIINGVTKAIKSSHIFSTPDINEFYVFEIDDVDNDQNKEIVAGNESFLYVINPSDFTVKWNSSNLAGAYQPTAVKVGNISNSSSKEIVICKGYLYSFDGVSHQQWQSTASNFNCIDLFDLNGDNLKEIIAGTNDGYIKVFSGFSHQIIKSFRPGTTKIDGIVVENLNNDNTPEIIYSSGGKLNFYIDSLSITSTRSFSDVSGSYNGLKVTDIDNDGHKELFVGTSISVLELNSSCYQCAWFSLSINKNDISCGGIDNGSISALASNGVAPYIYHWSTGISDSLINNLSTGIYYLTVSDNSGCEIFDTITISQAQLITNYNTENVSCNQVNDGMASIIISVGTPPYTYHWSNGSTSQSVTGLIPGDYTVTITDSLNCTSNHTINIGKDSIILFITKYDVSCYGSSDGSINLSVHNGTPPYLYTGDAGTFNTNSSYYTIYYLDSGNYSITVTDSKGCTAHKNTTIVEPPELLIQATSTCDNPQTPFGDGTATVNAIGGTMPYTVLWNDPFMQTTITAINLIYGSYTVTVTDSKFCTKSVTVKVDTVSGIENIDISSKISINPNVTYDKVTLRFDLNGVYAICLYVYNVTGKILLTDNFIGSDKSSKSIDISEFEQGVYFFNLIIDNQNVVYPVYLIK